jgi:hypothetical protein
MKAIDIAYRSVTAGLGVATIVLGVGLVANVFSGLQYHASVSDWITRSSAVLCPFIFPGIELDISWFWLIFGRTGVCRDDT